MSSALIAITMKYMSLIFASTILPALLGCSLLSPSKQSYQYADSANHANSTNHANRTSHANRTDRTTREYLPESDTYNQAPGHAYTADSMHIRKPMPIRRDWRPMEFYYRHCSQESLRERPYASKTAYTCSAVD